MRLNHKILIGLSGVLVIWVATLGEAFATMTRMEAEYHHAVEETLPVIITLDDLRFSAIRIVASTSEYGMIVAFRDRAEPDLKENAVHEQDHSEADFVAEGVKTFKATLALYRRQVGMLSPQNQDVGKRIQADGEALAAASDQIMTAFDDGLHANEILELKETLEKAELQLLSTLSQQVVGERRTLEGRHEEINQTIASGIRNLVISAVLALFWIAVIIGLSSWKIIKPIERLRSAVLRIAKGDFADIPEVAQTDEIGDLTIAFRDMSTSLQGLIRDHREATEVALASEQRFRDIAEASSDWIWETGPDHRLEFLSERFSEVTGLATHEVLGQTIDAFLTPDRIESDLTFDGFKMDGQQPVRDLRCRYDDIAGHVRVCRLSGKPLFTDAGEFAGYRGTASDITSEVEAQNIAQHLALHDALTGLPNRLLMAERLDQNLAKIKRNGGAASVICLDLDHFKEINDTLGHAAGDALLKSVSQRLEDTLRATDTLARLGGDEFVILQADADQPNGAEILCRRILQVIAEPHDIDGQKVYTGASLGVSLAPVDSIDHDQLLRNADVAMYRAKKEGRNSFRFFEAGMDAELQTRKAMERDLRVAVENGEMEMYYQPLIQTNGRAIEGVEALVRWHRPGFGLVPPDAFIPLAEETGLILPLGAWILRTSCLQVKDWPGLFVAVNLSPSQFKQQDLVGLVKQVLEETGLAPHRLELEITEGVLLEDTEYAIKILNGLQDLGVRIAMDDFGTGYSSLSYLQRFGFDKIKLDQSFVQALGESAEASAIVRTVLDLGKSLGMKTTAEGVETAAQLDFLTNEGCDQMQGYYFSMPVPAADIQPLLGRARLGTDPLAETELRAARSA